MFSNQNISLAVAEDAVQLKTLLDKAYRGEESRHGWATEAHLIEGDTRTDVPALLKLLAQPGSVILKYMADENGLTGCVNLQKHDNKIYLGMLAVNPLLQAKGTGRQMLAAAEEWAKQQGCSTIYMSVISVRTALIDWYIRHGYKDTGERKPFAEDGLTGKHLQPLEFMMMEKYIDA